MQMNMEYLLSTPLAVISILCFFCMNSATLLLISVLTPLIWVPLEHSAPLTNPILMLPDGYTQTCFCSSANFIPSSTSTYPLYRSIYWSNLVNFQDDLRPFSLSLYSKFTLRPRFAAAASIHLFSIISMKSGVNVFSLVSNLSKSNQSLVDVKWSEHFSILKSSHNVLILSFQVRWNLFLLSADSIINFLENTLARLDPKPLVPMTFLSSSSL